MPSSILFFTPCEVVYCPRIIKHAYYWEQQGYQIYTISPRLNFGNPNERERFLKEHSHWHILEIDISKTTLSSKIRWIYVSLLHMLKIKAKTNNIQLCKAYYAFDSKYLPKNVDYVMTSIIDCLPIAAQIAEKKNAKLIFDSQEFFTGQYQEDQSWVKQWIVENEKKYIRQASFVFATTNAMKKAICEKYQLTNVYRLRNTPYHKKPLKEKSITHTLRMVWHGMAIYYNSRGIHILVEALSFIPQDIDVSLTLQGFISEEEKAKIIQIAKEKQITHPIYFKQAAPPDKIIDSISDFDIGLIGEELTDENIRLTSSNKLFEYIHAGLAVLMPSITGLLETLEEYTIGESYQVGNAQDLAFKIQKIYLDRELLKKYQLESIKAQEELLWHKEVQLIFEEIRP